MASAARKIQKRLQKAAGKSALSTAAKSVSHGMVTMRVNPATGEMQEYHYTKGWR